MTGTARAIKFKIYIFHSGPIGSFSWPDSGDHPLPIDIY